MDLRKIADECGIGFLLDPDDELFKGPQMEQFAERVIEATKADASEQDVVKGTQHKD